MCIKKRLRSPLCHLNSSIFMQEWEFYFKQFFSSFYSSRVGCNFGKLVVALTFHQVDTSCAHRGRPCEQVFDKAAGAWNLIQVLHKSCGSIQVVEVLIVPSLKSIKFLTNWDLIQIINRSSGGSCNLKDFYRVIFLIGP